MLAAAATGGALAATPYQDISSAGPLTHIQLGDELSCQVAHTLDPLFLEFFPPGTVPGDCGTFVAVGGALYAPNFAAHGGTATGALGAYTPFTPVSQSAVTGAGSVADPFVVVTVADVGATGLHIRQTDSYVIGDEAYRTDVAISNSTGSVISGVLYRAGDCYLGGSDFGYGFTEVFGTRNAVGCSVNANNTPAGRIEEWVPLTGVNNFLEDFYGGGGIWSWIGTKATFPDTCDCALLQDNGAGISWPFAVGAGGSLTYSHFTTFSPTGKEALQTSKTADNPTSAAGTTNGYNITISNTNPDAVTLSSITDTLPAGFAYVSGSTTGVTTSNPSVAAQVLTWSGPFVVPANSSVTLDFSVTVANAAGDYYNEAGGVADGGYTVLPTGPTALITVTSLKSTSTTYTGSSSVQYSDSVALSGTLLDTSGAPVGIAGKQLDFTLGTQNASASPTNASGNASTSLVVTQTPGSVTTVQTAFAGDLTYSASNDSDPFAINKEDCTLAYTGDTLVNAANMTTLSAQFGELDSSPGSWTGKSITFTATGLSTGVHTFTASTNAAGVASTTAALGPDVYDVGVAFAGDAYYLACASDGTTMVTVQSAAAKITGGGWISVGTGNTNFGFNVIQDVTGLKGQLQVRSKGGKDRFPCPGQNQAPPGT